MVLLCRSMGRLELLMGWCLQEQHSANDGGVGGWVPSILVPSACSLWGVNSMSFLRSVQQDWISIVYNSGLIINRCFISFLPVHVTLLHPSTNISWDIFFGYFPNELLAPKSFSLGLLMGSTTWDNCLFLVHWSWLLVACQALVSAFNYCCLVTKSYLTIWNPMDYSMSFTVSQSVFKLMSIELVMPSNHLFCCLPLLLLPSIFPSIRVFSNVLAVHNRWPKYWSFSFSISPSNEYSGLIALGLAGLISLLSKELSRVLQQHNSKHQFFSAQPSLWSNFYIHTWLLEKP